VDVLVEFEPGHLPGLALFDMERELTGLLGRWVFWQSDPASDRLRPASDPQVASDG
jgi:predicted nucleotidyltransferase